MIATASTPALSSRSQAACTLASSSATWISPSAVMRSRTSNLSARSVSGTCFLK